MTFCRKINIKDLFIFVNSIREPGIYFNKILNFQQKMPTILVRFNNDMKVKYNCKHIINDIFLNICYELEKDVA